TRENIEPLLEALAEADVKQVTAGYLFERVGIAENLRLVLEERGIKDEVNDAFEAARWLTAPGAASARYLPRALRQRGYASLMALASKYGITVSVSGLLNPDFSAARPTAPPTSRQPLLPLFVHQPSMSLSV